MIVHVGGDLWLNTFKGAQKKKKNNTIQYMSCEQTSRIHQDNVHHLIVPANRGSHPPNQVGPETGYSQNYIVIRYASINIPYDYIMLPTKLLAYAIGLTSG